MWCSPPNTGWPGLGPCAGPHVPFVSARLAVPVGNLLFAPGLLPGFGCPVDTCAAAGRAGSTPVPVHLPDGSVLQVWPVLGLVEGDILSLAKLTNSIGHGGKHACYRCALNGMYLGEAKTVRCGRAGCAVRVGTLDSSPGTGPGWRLVALPEHLLPETSSVSRRWLGYAADIHQPLPCHADGRIEHREHPMLNSAIGVLQAEAGFGPGRLILPPRVLYPRRWPCWVRDEWTASVATDPSTWCTTSVRKYSKSETLARRKTAEEIRQQVRRSVSRYPLTYRTRCV